MTRTPFALAALGMASAASGHDGEPHSATPGWTFDLWVVVPLGLLLAAFLVGRARLKDRSGTRRSPWLFLSGWAVLALSLVSPLHEGGESSFTLHMIEHELIMLVATFLLAASQAGGILAWGLPAMVRRSLGRSWKRPFAAVWRWLTEPVTATIIQAAVMLLWHAPALFNRALVSPGWHIAQHMSFIAASLLFWTAMLRPGRGRYLLSTACLLVTSVVEGALGALMALSDSPWYPAYASIGLSGLGLDPVTDQQLAGLIMWVPGGLFHGAVAIVLLYRWLGRNQDSQALSAN